MAIPGSFPAQYDRFECSVCADDKEEAATWIDSTPICRECVTDSIIPKFHAALQHEANYPVEWSGSVTLRPQDFAKCFHPSFFAAWAEKQAEYETPVKDRLYCSCSAFLGQSATPHEQVYCNKCGHSACGQCGSREKPHICAAAAASDDPFKGLEGYKACPSCNSMCSLGDGCNDVKCQTCRTRFCWVCRMVNPDRQHWQKGNACPRFGTAGAQNALYNEDVVEDAGEDEIVENEFTAFDIMGAVIADVGILSTPLPSFSQARQESNLERWLRENDERHNARHLETGQHSAFIHEDQLHFNRAIANRLMQENTHRVALEATPQGVAMVRHREVLEAMHEHALTRRASISATGQATPIWLDSLIFVASRLLKNIELYVYKARILAGLEGYMVRDQEIMSFEERTLVQDTLERYPHFFIVFATYKVVGSRRLVEAAEEHWRGMR